LDSVARSTTDYRTQITQVAFRPGRPVDFDSIIKAIDNAGFPAQAIRVVATGWVVDAQGQVAFKVSGTGQVFPLGEGGQFQQAVHVKGSGQLVRVTAVVDLRAPHAWVIQELGPASQALRRGTPSIADVSGHETRVPHFCGPM
jgi:hypothetical protein